MGNLFKTYCLGSIVSGLLISINCYAIDSTGISNLALNSSKLITMRSETVADPNQCEEEPVTSLPRKGGAWTYIDTDRSSCPLDYPFPIAVDSVKKTYGFGGKEQIQFKCCKSMTQYTR